MTNSISGENIHIAGSTIVTENDATLKIDLTKKAKRRVRFFLFFNPVVYFVVIRDI